MAEAKKKLACSNCRKRRRRCDLEFPCSNCVKLGIECNVVEEDLRKKRYTNTYVRQLEERIRQLEANNSGSNTPVISTHPNQDPEVCKSIMMFYTWLYPGYFTFAHRESFIVEFLEGTPYDQCMYCSEEYIYAMASIGATTDKTLIHRAEEFYNKAKTQILKNVFQESGTCAKISTVQALFILAFWALGNGDNSLAWYYSGLAIRIGYDIGFHLNPKVWITEKDSDTPVTQKEVEIRSRIYWGCYVADHLICLILGKHSTLSLTNSTIPESDELPEIEGTEDYRYPSTYVLHVSTPLKNLIILSRITQLFTTKIFMDPSTTTEQKLEGLNTFNEQIYDWRNSLPEFLKWTERMQDVEVSTDPTLNYFWYHYYLVLLSFNKPFIAESEEARHAVIEIFHDLKVLIQNFNEKFTESYMKGTIYNLYCIVNSIQCLLKMIEFDPDNQQLHDYFSFFRNNLDNYTAKYKLAQNIMTDELKHTPAADAMDLPLNEEYNKVNSLSYAYDFTLSNEIDDFITKMFGTWPTGSEPHYPI